MPDVPDDPGPAGPSKPSFTLKITGLSGPVPFEDQVTSKDTNPTPDPDGGRNPDTDFLLRYLG